MICLARSSVFPIISLSLTDVTLYLLCLRNSVQVHHCRCPVVHLGQKYAGSVGTGQIICYHNTFCQFTPSFCKTRCSFMFYFDYISVYCNIQYVCLCSFLFSVLAICVCTFLSIMHESSFSHHARTLLRTRKGPFHKIAADFL